jgi:hypothetical protein
VINPEQVNCGLSYTPEVLYERPEVEKKELEIFFSSAVSFLPQLSMHNL